MGSTHKTAPAGASRKGGSLPFLSWRAGRRTLTAACLAALLAPAAPAASETQAPGVIRSFDRATPAEASLPADIRQGLMMDERSLNCFTGQDGEVRFEKKWFPASRIDLDGDGRRDWVVHSAHPCLDGSAGGRWWAFHSLEGGEHRLLLATHSARFDVLRKKAAGFRVIRAGRAEFHYSPEKSEYALGPGGR